MDVIWYIQAIIKSRQESPKILWEDADMQTNKKRTWYCQGNPLAEEIEHTTIWRDSLALWSLGQCGFVWKKDVTLYIDPVLNDIKDSAGITRR